MRRRQVLLDEETDRLLDRLAAHLSGNRSLAIREAIKTHFVVETGLDRIEALHGPELRRQKQRSEREFAKGRTVSWDEVKRRNRL